MEGNINFNENFEFVIQRGGKEVCIIQTKGDGHAQGMVWGYLTPRRESDTQHA